jgi:hypothetical protein
MQDLSPPLPPLVALLLLAFLWFILLVLLLWFALGPRRSPRVPNRAQRPAGRKPQREGAEAGEADVQRARPEARTVRVVRDPSPAAPEDAFDAYAKPSHRRDEFDF